MAIYGGKAYEGQIEQLKAGAQIVVGTPGRLIDLNNQRLLDLSNATEVVLDEADKMLDLGFLPDIEKIFQKVPAVRHTQLFSATMPGPIVALARRFMTNPIHIRATDPDEGLTQANIRHLVYRAHSLDKDEVIARILQADGRGKTVIFTRTKRAAQRLSDELGDRGFNTASVHGDMSQEARERSMAAFKAGKRDVLIATDVAARGIDVDDVTHVINHTIPDDEKTYLHRAGRTGRAGKTGIAVTFVDWDDLHKWALINRALEFGQPEPDRDVLVEPAPLRRPRHPGRHEGPHRHRAADPDGQDDGCRAQRQRHLGAPHPQPPSHRRQRNVGRRRDRRPRRRARQSPRTTARTTPPRAPAPTTAAARSTTTATPHRVVAAVAAAARAAGRRSQASDAWRGVGRPSARRSQPPAEFRRIGEIRTIRARFVLIRADLLISAQPRQIHLSWRRASRLATTVHPRRRPRRVDPRDQHDRDDHQQEPRHELRDRHRLPAVQLIGVRPGSRPGGDVLGEVDEDGDTRECREQRHPDHRPPHPHVHHRPRPQQRRRRPAAPSAGPTRSGA